LCCALGVGIKEGCVHSRVEPGGTKDGVGGASEAEMQEYIAPTVEPRLKVGACEPWLSKNEAPTEKR